MSSRNPAAPLPLAFHALAVFWLGAMAGFFWTYSANVNFATLEMDGATYALVQSGLNRNVRHAMFFGFFFGPPLLCALALATDWRACRAGWWRCLLLAGVLYGLGIVLFTAQVNLPLNAYTESWNPQALPPDWAQTRLRWNAANLWRTVASALAFGLGLAALCLRATAAAQSSANSAAAASSSAATLRESERGPAACSAR
ncbi:anthrone oxygenase family protein [Variovorax sp. 160MFSha2.1]|uniref:anthrone oxygenase family protein n=1 Tax=Variovorax sp. 160MFSha2.1 TaxID=3158367 RepID=UPI003AB0D838